MMKKLILTLGLLVASTSGSYGQPTMPDNITYSNNIILMSGLTDIPPAANNIKQIKIKQFEQDKVINESLFNYTATGVLAKADIWIISPYGDAEHIGIKLRRNKNGQWVKQFQIGNKVASNVTYQTDAQGRIVSTTTVALLAGEEQQQIMTYGVKDRLHSIENRGPNNFSTTVYGYGENGQIASIIDDDTVVVFSYDDQNRLIGSAYKYMSENSTPELMPITSYSNFDSFGNWQSAVSGTNVDEKYTREITYQ